MAQKKVLFDLWKKHRAYLPFAKKNLFQSLRLQHIHKKNTASRVMKLANCVKLFLFDKIYQFQVIAEFMLLFLFSCVLKSSFALKLK